MEISNTKTQQIITLFIILVIQFSPIILTSADVLPETKSSMRNPIARQQFHKVVTTYKVHSSPQGDNNPSQHSHSWTQTSWSVTRSSHSTHTWTVPGSSRQPDSIKPMSNLNPAEQIKQLHNMIQNSNQNKQHGEDQNSTPKPKSNPTELPEQPQKQIPNPTQQPKQPQNQKSNLSPSPIDQSKQPQNQKSNPCPPQQPKNQIPSPDPPQQSQSPPPNEKKPDTHNHKSPFIKPFKNNEPDLLPICSQSEVDEILKVHNNARVHASEPLYIWDEELADFARQWAKKRMHDCKAIHSYGPYGENIFWGLYDHWTIPKAVQSWVNEEKDYDKRRLVCQPGKLCGHYTQVVWRDTTKVGCARLKCAHGLGFFISCNYDPPGNYPNENPFEPHNHKYKHHKHHKDHKD